MSYLSYSDIADLMTETLIEINNMLYRELVFPVFKTTNFGNNQCQIKLQQ